MKKYSQSNRVNTHYSLRHDFTSLFKRIEFMLFCFLSIAVFVTSSLNKEFSTKVSETFIGISLPVVHFASVPFNVAIELLTNFQELVQARDENKILRAENAQLRSFYLNSLNANNENKELRKALRFITSKSTSYITAHINGRPNQLFNQALYIDAGENMGLKKDSLVSGNYGAIGRISEIFEHRSRLILATNANSRIPIITSNSRTRGVLAGNNSSVMNILYLQKNHAIQVGDRVFTSGDGDTLPSSILIGVVNKVGESFASVKLVENINDVDVVTIMDYSLKDPEVMLEEEKTGDISILRDDSAFSQSVPNFQRNSKLIFNSQ